MNVHDGFQTAMTALAKMAARLAAAIGFQPNIERRKGHRRATAADWVGLTHNHQERRAHADRRSRDFAEFA